MYQERLKEIVDFAYARLREKINGGLICVENEASLQLQLSSILKATGELYVRDRNEIFSIELEKPVLLASGKFEKSGTSKAKIDIWISFQNIETKTQHSCAIELKFFKRINHREPNNRYDVFADIQNLEAYGAFADLGYLIVATDHGHYVNQETYSSDTGDFDFRHSQYYESEKVLSYRTGKPHGPDIVLRNTYRFSWDKCAGGIHFLKLAVDTGVKALQSNQIFEAYEAQFNTPLSGPPLDYGHINISMERLLCIASEAIARGRAIDWSEHYSELPPGALS
jgi:hypothetical protein